MVLILPDYHSPESEEIWTRRTEFLYYAFQPIVNIHTGATHGFEALLRGYEEAGFTSIQNLFNEAYADEVLYSLDLHLREKALSALYSNPAFAGMKLFYNIDNRVLEMPNYNQGNTEKFLKENNLFPLNFCIELSEQHEFSSYNHTHQILRDYKEQNYRIAIDDFGTGYSGLTLLYHCEPDYIKIDRFFIENINADSRKKFFVANVVNLAHMMGINVIAEGIETAEEFFVCREIGCDFIQGYLIQKPCPEINLLLIEYPEVLELAGRHLRNDSGDKDLILREIKYIQPITLDCSAEEILEVFRNDLTVHNLPVLSASMEPLGILREDDLKKYVFSPYGISILQHKSSSQGLESLIFRSPVMEVFNSIEKILELYSMNENIESVIITENGLYQGILDSSAILRILSEKQISIARDQNPLTKLPGNSSITEYLTGIVKDHTDGHICVYFDFDNFKPFNDKYGFRQGDRIIRLFADLLKEHWEVHKAFTGHLGGDDFVLFYSDRDHNIENILSEIRKLIQRFEEDVLPFYNSEDRKNGYITSKSRSGRKKQFPLLTISAGIVYLRDLDTNFTSEWLSEKMALLKKEAKKSPTHMVCEYINTLSEDPASAKT
ncbi:MAG: EAL and GGDEF domain-containing protein [Spirochaetales bacterium]|uniref:EAL and GGDEF domain-containing protein n=1 Tax=Candidatus Thalassospirochaeta sargassi TaxID=3119039 RepID=A0AAJ1MJP7_9SPIO|nr:EAL and GGDEF domain-containing protein [Spirochaetales bacterium]